MANVVTQIEMMKYRGTSRAVFPVGTILTPSAKDWAREQGIEVAFEDLATSPVAAPVASSCTPSACNDKLMAVVNAVIKAYKEAGKSIVKEDVVASVKVALKALEKCGK